MSAIREERLVTLLLVSYERKAYPAFREYVIQEGLTMAVRKVCQARKHEGQPMPIWSQRYSLTRIT